MTAPFSQRLRLPVAPSKNGAWTYVTESTVGAVEGEELPLGQVSYSESMAAAGSLTGSFVFTARRADALRAATQPLVRSVVAYRNGQAQCGGIIIKREHDRSVDAVKLTVADWWWYLGRRRVTRAFRTPQGGLDQNLLPAAILAGVSVAGDIAAVIGLEVAADPIGVLRDRQYDPWSLAKVGDVLSDLSNIDGGSDMAAATVGTRGDVRRLLRVGGVLLGRKQADSGLVFDSTRLPDPTWTEDGSATATRWWSAGNGEEVDMKLASAWRADLEAAGLPVLEDYSSYKSVEDIATLQAHANADLNAAAGLRIGVTGGTRKVIPSEVLLGDEVRLQDSDPFYRGGRVNKVTRITGKKVSIPDSGADETVTPTFGEWVA